MLMELTGALAGVDGVSAFPLLPASPDRWNPTKPANWLTFPLSLFSDVADVSPEFPPPVGELRLEASETLKLPSGPADGCAWLADPPARGDGRRAASAGPKPLPGLPRPGSLNGSPFPSKP